MILREFLEKRNYKSNILIRDVETGRVFHIKNLDHIYLNYFVKSSDLLPCGEIVKIKKNIS